MELKEGIRASYLADGLSEEYLDIVCGIAREEYREDLSEIVRQDDPSRDLYVLLEGKAMVQSSLGDFIGRMKPGGLFGEVALFDARPRSATVSADGPVKLAVIPAEALNALIDERPEMGVLILRNLGRVLCERLRSSNFQVEAIILAL